MPYMRRRQEQIPAAHARHAPTLHRPAADRYVFPERVPVAAHQFRALAAKRHVLRINASHAERMECVVASELRRPADHRVRMHHASVAQLYVFADHRVRTHFHAHAQPRVCSHYRLRVNLQHSHFDGASGFGVCTRSIILHISVASAANCPFTSALPASLQKSPRHESTSISIRNWSPGTTGRRNRAPSTATKYSNLLSRSGISSSNSNPPVCAIDSMISTPGITGCPGKWPWK